MIRYIVAILTLLVPISATADDWYVSPTSPFTSDNIEGTQCRYYRADSTDPVDTFSPVIRTDNIVNAEFEFDQNYNSSGTGQDITVQTCTDEIDTGTCSALQADITDDGIPEDAALTSDVKFIATTGDFMRVYIDVAAISPGATRLKVCGTSSSIPPGGGITETDPIFSAMDTEAELEAQLGGLDVYTANDGPLGGAGDPSTWSQYAATQTVDMGNQSITNVLLVDGRDLVTDGAKLDSIEASATADQTDVEIATAYGNQVAQVSGAEITAGIETNLRTYSVADVVAIVAAHESSGGATTEIGLESDLTDVTDVFTNNDGALSDDDLSDNDTGDLSEGTNLYYTEGRVTANVTVAANASKLAGIEVGATADQTDAEIATAYGNEVAQVSGAEITAGIETALRTYSVADVVAIVAAHETSGSVAFTDLTDVDQDYTGDSLKFVRVNAGETGLEFTAGTAVGAFTDLTDVDNDYTGDSLKLVRVNAGETGLEFVTGGGGITNLSSSYSVDQVEITNDNGDNAVILDATSTEAGVMNTTDKKFLDSFDEYICDNYSGSDIGEQCNSAYTQAIADESRGVILRLARDSYTQTTQMDFCDQTGVTASMPVILRGHGRARTINRAGTFITAGSGLATAATTASMTTAAGAGPGGRDTITCATCTFLTDGYTRGDLLEITSFVNAENNFGKGADQLPAKIYSATETVLVLEGEDLDAGLVVETATASVRKLQAQVEMCRESQWVEGINFDGDSANEYADIAVHFRPDNNPNEACTAASTPYTQCSALGTGSLVAITSNNSGVRQIRADHHGTFGVAITSPNVQGQADHFEVTESSFNEIPIEVWADNAQTQPGVHISHNTFSDWMWAGMWCSSGNCRLSHNTFLSDDADCVALTHGECPTVKTTPTFKSLVFENNNVDVWGGNGIDVTGSQSLKRSLVVRDNVIHSSYDPNESCISTDNPIVGCTGAGTGTLDYQLVDAAEFCGIIVNDGNLYTNNGGPLTGNPAPQILFGNSNHPSCPTTVTGKSEYRDRLAAGPDPELVMNDSIYYVPSTNELVGLLEPSAFHWTNQHTFAYSTSGDIGGLVLPSDAAPSLQEAGEIALDTTILGYGPMFRFEEGANAQDQFIVAIDVDEVSTPIQGDILYYDSTEEGFKFDPVPNDHISSIDMVSDSIMSGGVNAITLTSGSGVSGQCAQWNANGNLEASGDVCGSGGGGDDITTDDTFTNPVNPEFQGTTSIDVVATDSATDTIQWVVLPGGVDHNSLNNYEVNRHIDWTANTAGTIDPTNYTDNNTQLTQAQVEDFAGGIFTGNTETGITATYQGADNTLDLVIDDPYIEDLIGAMATAGVQTNITVTYDDINNELDFVASGSSLWTTGTNYTHLNTPDDIAQANTSPTWSITNAGVATFTGLNIEAPADVSGTVEILEGTNYGTNKIIQRGPDGGWLNDVEYVWPTDNAPNPDHILGINNVLAGVITLEWQADAGGGGDDITVQGTLADPVNPQFIDTASVGVESTDLATDTIEWSVIPGGVDHNSLNNYEVNRHIDWTAVAAGTIDTTNYVDNNTQRTDEEISDIAGALVGDGTGVRTGIAITFQDATDDIDVIVDHDTANNFLAAEHVDWAGVGAGTIDPSNYVDNNTQLTESQVNDFVGAMVTGNTETGITVTYEAGDGTLDFVVTGGAGDNVEINGVAATDPDFTDAGDVDFIRCTAATTPDGDCAEAEDVLIRYQDASVTYAKIQNVSQTDVLLGRDTVGAGVIEEISPTNVKTILSLDNVENTQLSTWTGSSSITTVGALAAGSANSGFTINTDTVSLDNTWANAQVAEDLTLSSSSTVTLPSGTGTNIDGRIEWDSTSETIKIGDDGVAVLEFFPLGHIPALTQEEVEDYAGGMFSGNTETGITATYQVADNTVDLEVTLGDSIDLASEVGATILPAANGGTGVNSSASNGVPFLVAGAWSFNTIQAAWLDETSGSPTAGDVLTFAGTGDDFTWVENLPLENGGTGGSGASSARTNLDVPQQGEVTDTQFCVWDGAGTEIDCNIAFTGTGSVVRADSPTITTQLNIPANAAPGATSSGELAVDNTGGTNITSSWLNYGDGTDEYFIMGVREEPTVNGQALVYNSSNGDVEWSTPSASFNDIDTDYGAETVTVDWVFQGASSTGAMGAYDLSIGSGTGHGGIRIGDAAIYNSSYVSGSLDLGQAVVIKNENPLDVTNDPGIEFAIIESASNNIRFAIPESATGNATAMMRSVTIAGPFVANNDIVTCDHWSADDTNLACNTSGEGADLFVQNDLEVEGTLFLHQDDAPSAKPAIMFEGLTPDAFEVSLDVGADPTSDIALTLPIVSGAILGNNDSPNAAGDISGDFNTGLTIDAAIIDGDNLATSIAGRSLVLTAGSPDQIDADEELYRDECNVTIETAVVDDDVMCGKATGAITLTNLDCTATGGTANLQVGIYECDATGDTCVDSGFQVTVNNTTGNFNDDATGNDAAIGDGNWWQINIESVTSAPTYLHCQAEFTRND